MKRTISPLHLGGSLYLSAMHKNLKAILLEHKYPFLKSIIIDFEDALDAWELETAQKRLTNYLELFKSSKLLVFVRPRDSNHLAQLLTFAPIEKIDGFVLAKATPNRLESFMKLLKGRHFWMMPVLEDKSLLHPSFRVTLFERLASYKKEILSLRFGAEDLSQHLNIHRDCQTRLYEYAPLYHLAMELLTLCGYYGFTLSAGVFSCYKDEKNFLEEIALEQKCGFFGKTLIHPQQAKLLHRSYRISKKDLQKAQAILKSAQSIGTHQEMMLERTVHTKWAQKILAQEAIYGLV